jgi:hypothetical protein
MSLAIIGPAALQILEKDNVRIILFSDIHGNAKKLPKMHEKIFNLDDFILTLMRYNSKNNKKTDLYVEVPCYTVKCTKGNEYVGQSRQDYNGWLGNVRKTTESAISDNNPINPTNNFLMNCRVHHIDARQNDELGYLDVLTWSGTFLQELILSRDPMTIGNNNIIGTPVCVILELLDVISVLINNADSMWNMYCDPFGFRNVLTVIKALENLNKEGFSKAARSIISLMTRNTTCRRDINVNGEIKRIQMHKIALQHYKLLNINKSVADFNYSSLYNKYKSVVQIFNDKHVIENVKFSLKKYDILCPISKVDCMEELAHIIMYVILLGAFFMDMYAISRVLYNISDDIIIYAGGAHINTYYDLLQKHGYKSILEVKQHNDDRVVCVEDIFLDLN